MSQWRYICADPELPQDPVRWGLATVSAVGDIHPALQLNDPATSMGSADAGARDLALPTAEVEFLPWETALKSGRYSGDPRSCRGDAFCREGVSLVGFFSLRLYQVRWAYFPGKSCASESRSNEWRCQRRDGTAGLVSSLKPVLTDGQNEGRRTRRGLLSTSR